ncbi:fungal-specific transcription factor domain-containing protein [Stachybotrys elegans]|uniref:Fungal-specific transcription factor domain-containing protein n=1 Tax=Stachybotrys elegans TaxID=80388 RepID=A0A8K0SY20_9HYPO|nr:fungal-specific transcription factor domain-containing protein [Stachybotrys elegans]
MPAHEATPLSPKPAKRPRLSSFDDTSPSEDLSLTEPGAETGSHASSAAGKPGQSSNFRNVSACNRCRLRKNRCDQKLPSCASCAKAGVACVGYDPITKKEIPRSYVFYLETRVERLEALLTANNISFPPASNLDICSRVDPDAVSLDAAGSVPSENGEQSMAKPHHPASEGHKAKKQESTSAMLNIVSPSKPRSLASASGVSFARVVRAAVQYSVSDQTNTTDRSASRHPSVSGTGTSMRDSFFGLHTKPTIQPAPFPDKDVATRLVDLYFGHANPQIPILHRGEFMQMFEQAYTTPHQSRGARELYMLNMVFAIGSGVIVGEPIKTEASDSAKLDQASGKRPGEPEEYHASAIVHLESCLSASGGGLDVLQAVLLLANFALLRPVPPGLWYIIGVAVRLAIDLGLHTEEAGGMDGGVTDPASEPRQSGDNGKDMSDAERGKRLWMRDKRRRLWWCTYAFDRLVSTCVGRPFGINDQVIVTELPSLLDDDYITPTGFLEPPNKDQPSYKHVAHHYFRLRLLQSEILQVLQYNQAQAVRAAGPRERMYPELHSRPPSPFLVQFDSFRSWRIDIDKRLYQWKNSAPTRLDTGVPFSTEFLELNYWQAIIMLYRQSLSVPAMFEGEYNTSNEVNSPTAFTAELREDEDRIYLKVAEAGQKILRIYRALHLSGLVSYTYLSTHHLFMAGISYLYAIWHSPVVRSRLTMDEVDFTILAAKSVFTDMIDKCPPAEACRDAFDRTAKATIKMASSTGGFGVPETSRRARREPFRWTPTGGDTPPNKNKHGRHRKSEQAQYPFDMVMPDNMSSSSVSISARGDTLSPSMPVARQPETDHYMMQHGGPSPVERPMKQEVGIRDVLHSTPSPAATHRSATHHTATSGSLMSPTVGMQSNMDFPDTSSMEFLQSLGSSTNGDLSTIDTTPLDLGYGMNWEGLPNEFGDGQQMNLFDTFFFGGQQGGNGGGGMGL